MYLLFGKLLNNYRSVVAALASLNEVRAFLNISWSQYWKRNSLVAWPQGSPDIMPPKFFLVGICEEYCVPRDCTKCWRHWDALQM